MTTVLKCARGDVFFVPYMRKKKHCSVLHFTCLKGGGKTVYSSLFFMELTISNAVFYMRRKKHWRGEKKKWRKVKYLCIFFFKFPFQKCYTMLLVIAAAAERERVDSWRHLHSTRREIKKKVIGIVVHASTATQNIQCVSKICLLLLLWHPLFKKGGGRDHSAIN